MKKESQLNWQKISMKGVNFENLFMSFMAYAFVENNQTKHKKFGSLYITSWRQIDGHRDMLKSEVDRFNKTAAAAEKRKPGSILQSYFEYEKILGEWEKFGKVLDKTEVEKYPNSRLANFFIRFTQVYGKPIIYGYNYYFYQHLGERLYEVIREREKDIHRQSELFEVLSQARELSVMQKEQKALLLLVKKIDKSKQTITGRRAQQLIERHARQFSYMGCYYFRGKPWTGYDISRRIKNKLKTDYEMDLYKIIELEKESKHWLDIAKRLKFNRENILLIKTLKQMAYCTNRYDEVGNYVGLKARPLLYEVARRIGVSYGELIEMGRDEIVEYLQNSKKVSADFRRVIRRRQKDSALIMVDSRARIITGKDLEQYRKKEFVHESVNQNIKEMKGQSASAGVASGQAVLIYGITDLAKVKKGNIMIAKSTVPSFVPAMEKAAAIATELGGLLSHAAIVARELKTPCVVGIKNIMDVISSGDIIEVNGTKGIVRKL